MTATLCAATFSNSYVLLHKRCVMLRFVAVPFLTINVQLKVISYVDKTHYQPFRGFFLWGGGGQKCLGPLEKPREFAASEFCQHTTNKTSQTFRISSTLVILCLSAIKFR